MAAARPSTPAPTASAAARAAASIVLKRLADAIADGDRVLALIRGSAVNQDGHSTVLAAPNGLAQQALIREALANAQVEPDRIGYRRGARHRHGARRSDRGRGARCHGRAHRARRAAPCLLGSAKANIGHLEAAAGVAGVIKSVLVLQHERGTAAGALQGAEPAHLARRQPPQCAHAADPVAGGRAAALHRHQRLRRRRHQRARHPRGGAAACR